jgi:hypothetical protein
MAKLTATQGMQIDDGSYEATLLSIEECEPTPNSPNQNPWLKWIFHVYISEDGTELSAASSMAFGPKAKARGWMEALLGRKLAPGEEIDTETICPRDCQVVIKNDATSGFARIEDVMAPRRRPPVKPAKRPPAPRDSVDVDDELPY